MSGDVGLDTAPTYAVVDKKVKGGKKKPKQSDPGMEMYSVIDDSKKGARSPSQQHLTDPVDDGGAPTYDMVDHTTAPSQGSDSTYSKFDRTTGAATKAPQATFIPPKEEESQKKKFTKVTLASLILFIVLSVILVVLLIALVVAFIQIVNLRSRLNTLKASSTSSVTSTDAPLDSSVESLNANLTMLQMNFEDLKSTINSLFENVSNETLTDLNEREQMLNEIAPTFYSALNTLEVVVPRNLSEIEMETSERLQEIMLNITSTLNTLRSNVTEELMNINNEVQSKLHNIELVANQTILRETPSQ